MLGLSAAAWVGVTVVALALGFLLERASRSRRVWAVPLGPGQLRHELIGNAVFVAIAIPVTALVLHFGWIRFAAPAEATTLRAVGTFIAMFFAFQAYYYAVHRLMHHRAVVRIHRWHHASRVTTPLSGQSMSWAEAVLWMVGYFGLPALFSLATPLSFAGYAAYLVFNVIGNIVGHANAEAVAPSRLLWWRSTVATVFTYHALHHARWTGHYGFASTWADRLFKSEWGDWTDLHARVWRGEAMTSLKQRGQEKGVPGKVSDTLQGL